MSKRYIGGLISAFNILKVANAPTIGTPTAGNAQACVAFTAPSCVGGGAITSYTAVSCPGFKTGTGTTSPIQVTCLSNGTAYTFTVSANNAYGPSAFSAASSSVTPINVGSQSYTTAGTYSWVAPAGVTSVSVVAVGGGGRGFNNNGGGGGGLGYKNNITVIPGNSYTVSVGCSYFCSASVVKGGQGADSITGGTHVGTGGGNGGAGGNGNAAAYCGGGGGGAGGYSGNGGAGGAYGGNNGFNGSNGGGGGGRGRPGSGTAAGSGGGVGILGLGSSGAGGTCANGGGGKGGSGGADGGNVGAGSYSNPGGNYGGGGGGGGTGGFSLHGGCGAVRIVWPGNTRSFPSTCVGNP